MSDQFTTKETPTAAKTEQPGPIIRMIGWSRYVVVIAVIGTFIGSVVLLLVGSFELFSALAETVATFGSGHQSGELKVALIESVESFLVAVTLLIITLGLYQLFVGSVGNLPVWLITRSVNDLEKRLVGMVISVLAVVFMIQAVQWQHGLDILWFGLAIGAVVLAISVFLLQESSSHHE
jgi:uncharacterized membrane protein YqhA